jgi:hypothetical protein
MPNQQNFVQRIPGSPRAFPISRIAESEGDADILQGRTPGQFGFNTDDNIEMHFYDSVNNLVGSVIVPVSSGIISAKTLILPDGTVDEKVIIDMTRVQNELGLLIPPGTYGVSMNFFSNEIGSYTNPKMIIEEVSPSRTELRLGFTNNTVTSVEQNELFEFVQPSVPRVIAAGLVSDTLGVNQQGDIQIDEEIQQFIDTTRIRIQQFVDKVFKELIVVNPGVVTQLIDLEPETPDNLKVTIESLVGDIYDEFVSLLSLTQNTKQFDRLQETEMNDILIRAIDTVLTNTNINLFTQGQILYVTDDTQ